MDATVFESGQFCVPKDRDIHVFVICRWFINYTSA